MRVTFQLELRRRRIVTAKHTTAAAIDGATPVKIASILSHNSSRNTEPFAKKS